MQIRFWMMKYQANAFVLLLIGQWLLLCGSVLAWEEGSNAFNAAVRTSEPLTALEERETFVVPEGFTVDLVASEPAIQKPMNMSFDTQGRLWVSMSSEYPFPAEAGTGKDQIQVLEDTNGDGEFDTTTVFADDLNIPIGLYPYLDGVVCFSIPNIWFLRDTDGDGKCDSREKLYGPFDCSRDTHGMCNGFRRGFDGWVYACHGFNNQSRVAGSDGHQIELNSGNTFRFKLDGSRIEKFTTGQVNPFGLAWDQDGNLFSADCHTKPLSLLLRSGYYESFGKPHDGLGFVPNVMEHLHGSTAIAGVCVYEATNFPREFHGNTFGGNVMTSRINRNQLVRSGGSIRAESHNDFLTSSDPWFRPVDIQLSPDGSLFVADFYNRIIGHYEVPLEHPGRDRTRGRIWKVKYGGGEKVDEDLRDRSVEACIGRLSSSSLLVRKLAVDELVDAHGEAASDQLRSVLMNVEGTAKLHAAWALLRLGKLTPKDWKECMDSPLESNRVHAMKMLDEWDMPDAHSEIVLALNDHSALVQRAAVNAIRRQPAEELLLRLLGFLAMDDDPHLQHTAKLATRDVLLASKDIKAACMNFSTLQLLRVLPICLAVRTQASAEFLLENLSLVDQQNNADDYYAFMASQLSRDASRQLTERALSSFADQPLAQERILRQMHRSIGQTEYLQQWGVQLCCQIMGCESPDEIRFPLSSWGAPTNPGSQGIWQVSKRRFASDGDSKFEMLSSFPAGESKVGRIRSPHFKLESDFGFFLAGHDGFPDKEAKQENMAKLFLSETKQPIATWPAPRNDIAQFCQLVDNKHVGQQVFLELIDANNEGAFAWIAAGRFTADQLSLKSVEQLERVKSLIVDLRLTDFVDAIERALRDAEAEGGDTISYLELLQAIAPHPQGDFLVAASQLQSLPTSIVTEAISTHTPLRAMEIRTAFQQVTIAQQRTLAGKLANSAANCELLLELLENGWCSSQLLSDEGFRTQVKALVSTKNGKRLEALLDGLAIDQGDNVEVENLLANIRKLQADLKRGSEVFSASCKLCHRIGDKGGQVGPNLDGIGTRGKRRLAEDLLYPNRNVDRAFRASLLITEDGRVLNGLIKESTDDVVTLFDSKGKEHRVSSSDILKRRELRQSPMPANFHEVLTTQQIADVLAYLEGLRE